MKLHDIVDHLVDTVYRTDASGNIEFMSSSVEDSLGYTLEELVGTPMSDLYVNPSDREAFLQALKDGGGATKGFDASLRHKDGSTVWVSTSARIVFDEAGNVEGIEGSARNVTEEHRLEMLNTQLGRIIENSLTEIYIINAQTLQFTMVNRGARENLGYSMQELQGMYLQDLQPQATREAMLKTAQPLLNGDKETVTFESVALRKDGTEYPIYVNLQYAGDEYEPVFIVNSQDLTESKRTTSQLLDGHKIAAMHQLSGGIAHDFNNLLMVLQGNIELLSATLDEDPNQKRFIEAALAGIKQAGELTHRLLTFSQQQFLNLSVQDMRVCAARLKTRLRTLDLEVEIQIEQSAEPMLIEVDEDLLESALVNLCLNAQEATSDGHPIVLHVHQSSVESGTGPFSEGITIDVRDKGRGMDQGEFDRIFEPFFSTKTDKRGTGLGLSMVHGFVKQSKGHIDISTRLGQGTSVKLHFQRAHPQDLEKKVVSSKNEQLPTGQETILLIKSDDQSSPATETFLTKLGYQVHQAQDVDEATQLASSLTPDLLISDLSANDPKPTLDLATTLEKIHPACRVLLLTQSKHSPHTVVGDHHTLTKPATYATLAEGIRNLFTSPAG